MGNATVPTNTNSLMVGSSAIQGAGSLANAFSQSQALKTQGEFQQRMMAMNARLTDLQVQDTLRRGQKDVSSHKRKVKQLIGKQKAALAAQGIDITSGSAADVLQETHELGALDAMEISNNAWREAWGLKVQSANQTFQGEMANKAARAEAKQTLLAGGLSAMRYGLEGANYYMKGKPKDAKKPDYGNYPGG